MGRKPVSDVLILLTELIGVAMDFFLLRKKKQADIFKILDHAWPMEKEKTAEE